MADTPPPYPPAEQEEKVQEERETACDSGMERESAPPFLVVDIVSKVMLPSVSVDGYTLISRIPPFPEVRVIEAKREEEMERDERV